MLEDIMRFVIALLVPAGEVAAIEWIVCDISVIGASLLRLEPTHELRNPLAFVHRNDSLLLSEMRGKPARVEFVRARRASGHGAR
jgi:hypothetical protein